jgi:serine protease Do
MSVKTKHILAICMLVAVAFVTGCSFLSPLFPASPQSDKTIAHTNPDWTFPSENELPSVALPDFRPVIAKVMPSVVSVTTETVFSGFFGQYTQRAAGSGVIIDSDGYVVTNNHVVEGARTIYVELTDGRIFSANIVGTDPLSDLAVIKIDARGLPHADWGDSSLLSVGEWVIAIGNALGEGITASEGIVSRLNVSVEVQGNTLCGLIQTTAAINPGNSGGPLVNMAGEVVGITSVKMAALGVEGMGYAISSNEAKYIIPDLIRHGRVTYPWLGVGVYTVDPYVAKTRDLPVERGALIVEIARGSPADVTGLQVGDVIIRFKDKQINNVADLIQAIRSSQVGEEVEITFVRGKSTNTVVARLIERPST